MECTRDDLKQAQRSRRNFTLTPCHEIEQTNVHIPIKSFRSFLAQNSGSYDGDIISDVAKHPLLVACIIRAILHSIDLQRHGVGTSSYDHL